MKLRAVLMAASACLVGPGCVEARTQPAPDTPSTVAKADDPLCVYRDGTDFRHVVRIRLAIWIPGFSHGDPECEGGIWRAEVRDEEFGTTSAPILTDQFRRGFVAEGWEPVVDEPLRVVYRGPCSPTIDCEATVEAESTGRFSSRVDAVLVGRRNAPVND